MVEGPTSRPPEKGPTGRSEPVTRRAEIDAFLATARNLAKAQDSAPRGRMMFALDATMSRQPTWDIACRLQADMFAEAASIGGLDVQLVYFRGLGECRASRWVADAAKLAGLMSKIDCRGGNTQLRKVLAHARQEADRAAMRVLVFVGDACEEDLDGLCARAGELGLLGVRAFMFQEGNDPDAARGFREVARLTQGAYCQFDSGAAHELAELLRAAAAYAAGGLQALSSVPRTAGATALLQQLR